MLRNLQQTKRLAVKPAARRQSAPSRSNSSVSNLSVVTIGVRAEMVTANGQNGRRGSAAGAAAGERPTILVAEKLGQAGIDMLSENGNVDTSYNMSPEDLKAKMANSDALIVRSATKVTREVIEAGKGKLKVVGRAGVGIDNVDLAAATENGVMVVNAPNANTVAAAEHGIALLCALSRNVAQADASVKVRAVGP